MKRNISKICLFILTIAFVGFLGNVNQARGLEFDLNYTPPCIGGEVGGNCPSDEQISGSIASYIKRIYMFSVGIAGVLAVGMIVVGAIMISVSAGNPDKQREGRDYITSALWGVALLLGSYLILRTINPRLVNLSELERTTREARQVRILTYELAAGAATTTCPTEGQTGCFFNENNEACPFDLTSDAVCTSLDSRTSACDNVPDTNAAGETLSPSPRYPCACWNCKVLNTADYPVKTGACPGTLARCFLEEDTLDAFKDFIEELRDFPSIRLGSDGPGVWRVTEAFPPAVRHSSLSHYNGRGFDFGRGGTNFPTFPSPTDAGFCNEIRLIATAAARQFNRIYIEALPDNYCRDLNPPTNPIQGLTGVERRTFQTTTGFHIHVENPK
ncbi:MAG TPA: pilin [Candidatus Paceibacterota bacterium]|nr:pilin [Candidatus Paceibacterota bacterium]